MSFWTNIRDAGESIFSDISPIDIRGESARKKTSGVGGAANRIRDKEADIWHQVSGTPTADEKRNRARDIADQVKAQKDLTEITRQEIASRKDEIAAEKRRVNEKQIRQLRRNYSAPSLMGGAPSNPENGMHEKLGD